MVRMLAPEEVKYQVLSGVSAGSINLGGLATWEIGEELNATEWMVATQS
jgi:predicted acylesterase/phospholipase RssA